MLAGQTAYKNGYQVALFPLDYLYCTQTSGPGQFSHCCGTATDWIGTTASYPFYAPCDCHRVYSGGSDNIRAYVSDSEVLTPDGVTWLCFAFMHDNNPPDSQTSFRQGELIGHTGTAGHVTGDHMHLDQSPTDFYQLVDSGYACSGSSGHCFYQYDGITPEHAYFITGDETIVNTMGMQFQTVEGYTPGPGPGKTIILPIRRGRRVMWYMGR